MDGLNGFAPLDIKVKCNTSDYQIIANVRENAARCLPELEQVEAHEGIALLIGGGPSLIDTLDKIKLLAADGAKIFALNGASKWLGEHGVPPDFQVIIDPRDKNREFLLGPSANHLYLGAQCHPSLFGSARAPITLFYTLGTAPSGKHFEIGGGVTVGLTAMALAFALGYRQMHLFGYDSSERRGNGHAYEQEADGDEGERIEVQCGGHKFIAQPGLLAQAQEFPKWATLLSENGVDIHVHGSGLLPTIAREMQKPVPDDAACYDLGHAPSSWNFAEWLIAMEMRKRARGCDLPLRVALMPGPNDGFRFDSLPVDTSGRRQLFENVVRPMLKLIGAAEDPTAYNGHRSDTYVMRPITDMFRKGQQVPKFTATAKAKQIVDEWLAGVPVPIVITLREADHWPLRNSSLDAWKKFADQRTAEGEVVVFVRDTQKAGYQFFGYATYPEASTDIDIRCALYERARCNLFVCNGPLALALFGDRPYLAFKPLSDGWPVGLEFWRQHVGIEIGDSFPWARPDQRLIWADDTIDELEKAWTDLRPLLEEK